MAACSNGHSNPENEIYCGKREASVVALNQGLLAHSSTAGMGQEPQESLPGIASAQRLPPIAVALLFAVIAAVICVAVTFAISDSRADPRPLVACSACHTFRADRSTIIRRSGGGPHREACTARHGSPRIPGLSRCTMQFRESSSGDWQNTKVVDSDL
jgi:hypothetical protein